MGAAMAEKTGIAWEDSTFNPWVGCTKISPACDNCYAEKWGARFGYKWGPGQPRHRTSASTWRQPLLWNKKAAADLGAWEHGKRMYHEGWTDEQMAAHGYVKPTRPRVFCGSLCDVFDNAVPQEWRNDLFRLIAATPNLDYLLLTKRIGNAERMIFNTAPYIPHDTVWPFKNVWIGATICNREEMLRDGPKLKAVPAAKYFWSVEPMLGDLGEIPRELMPDQIIVGGETGKHARPMHPNWVRSLRDQCVDAGIPYFFKQWGEWHPQVWTDGSDVVIGPDDGYKTDAATGMVRCGKKAAGRMLDGREWNEVPA